MKRFQRGARASIFIVAVVVSAASLLVSARALDRPDPARIAATRSALVEEMRWGRFIHSVYTFTAFEKCLTWPNRLRDRISAIEIEAETLEALLRVGEASALDLKKAEDAVPRIQAERLALLRDIDAEVFKRHIPPGKSIYDETGGK